MKLDYILVDKNYHYFNKIKHLYEHAFPSVERPPFSILLSLDKNKLYAVENNKEFVGLVSTIEYQDLLYIFFLAIKKKYRGKGYGSQVLQDILSKHVDQRVYLLAEDPDVPNSNQLERDFRVKFYNKNGLIKTDVKIVEYGVAYVALTNGKKVSKEDFLNTMKYILGDFYNIYKQNVL